MTADYPAVLKDTEKDFHIIDMAYVTDGALSDGNTTPYPST